MFVLRGVKANVEFPTQSSRTDTTTSEWWFFSIDRRLFILEDCNVSVRDLGVLPCARTRWLFSITKDTIGSCHGLGTIRIY